MIHYETMRFETLRDIGSWAVKHPDTIGNVVLAFTAGGISKHAYDQHVYASPPGIVRSVEMRPTPVLVVPPEKMTLDRQEVALWTTPFPRQGERIPND